MCSNYERCDRISGCVQLGKASLSIGPRDASGWVEYTVTAPVVPHWGLQPKPGALWILQDGRTTDDDSAIAARQSGLYRNSTLVRFEGRRCSWPYQAR